MRYIKTYSEKFNWWNPCRKKKLSYNVDLKQDIREICYDITDEEKFRINFNTIKPSGGFNNARLEERNCIEILPTPYKKDKFRFIEVKDVVIRIVDYLETKFSHIYIHGLHNGLSLDKIEEIENLEDFDHIKAIYIRYNK
jgi:hypothetical protein